MDLTDKQWTVLKLFFRPKTRAFSDAFSGIENAIDIATARPAVPARGRARTALTRARETFCAVRAKNG
jgi:hypothetical protein